MFSQALETIYTCRGGIQLFVFSPHLCSDSNTSLAKQITFYFNFSHLNSEFFVLQHIMREKGRVILMGSILLYIIRKIPTTTWLVDTAIFNTPTLWKPGTDKTITADNTIWQKQNSHPIKRISPLYNNQWMRKPMPNTDPTQHKKGEGISWEQSWRCQTCRQRKRWRGKTHLEWQVLKSGQLEEEEMMEGIERRIGASDTCRSQLKWLGWMMISMGVTDEWMSWPLMDGSSPQHNNS